MSRFREEIIGDARLILGDCREVLSALGREHPFDALVTDPPYGIGEAAGANASRANLARARAYGDARWDDETADDALSLASAYAHWQIIFGGNYYNLGPTSCWLVRDKVNGSNDFADCELAWTNLPKAVRRLRYMWNGMLRANGEERGDHPTQKPIGVMKWALQQLPLAEHPHVFDPFMGSGTTGVACLHLGLKFTGIERETQYFDIACRRIEEAWRQPRLFDEPRPKATQETLQFD